MSYISYFSLQLIYFRKNYFHHLICKPFNHRKNALKGLNFANKIYFYFNNQVAAFGPFSFSSIY